MKIIRRIFGNIDNRTKKTRIENALGIKLDDGYFNHDLDEKSEEYSKIEKLVHDLNLQDDVIGTEFTKKEIEEARTLVFRGVWATGYPQPEDPKEVIRNTYANSCPECGIHDDQKAPFQMKEPNLGKHKMMNLNWINDEIFAEHDLYDRFFKDFGIGMREAILFKKNIPVKTVVQLNIPKAEFTFDMKGIDFSICPICDRKKYFPVVNGFFPAPTNLNFHIIKTQEYFGSGYSAFNKIMVSNEIMTKMIENKLAKYYHFIPAK